MRYLEGTTLKELMADNQPPHVRKMAEELLRMIVTGRTKEGEVPIHIGMVASREWKQPELPPRR